MIPIIGPKWSMISMGLPAVGGWVLLAIGLPLDETIDPVWLFYMGRILTGIGGGAFALVAPLFLSEIAEIRIQVNHEDLPGDRVADTLRREPVVTEHLHVPPSCIQE